MVNSLNTKWKELLFSFTGFGPNFLMVLMGAYFTDAINPVALGDASYQAIASGTCFILPLVFPILYMISKIFDGIIDIPFAHITDTLSTKWGRRRPAIAVCSVPMIVSYAMCWLPIGGADGQLFNTIWISIWCVIFFATYTMCLIAFYGSLSTVCTDEPQRLRVSGYKSFFDTISYCLVYALVPIILDGSQLHIDQFVFICLPLMLTIAIPLFMIKEGEKYGYPENRGLSPKKIKIGESIKLTFKNRIFANWLIINSCTFFGLQMFLVAMNAMIIGSMGFNGLEMAIINTCAFGPVPVMLWLFNKLKAKKGIRFTYQTCLIAFAFSIMSFFFASKFIAGDNKIMQYVIACVGGVMGSWSIGAFFMMPYLAPAQISSVEEKLTGKNHSAMYFAANAVVTSIVGAVSSSLVYENIKNLFFARGASGIKLAENYGDAAAKFGVAEDNVFNLGTLLVPFVVAVVCIIGAIIACRMPKDYTPTIIAKELKRFDPTLDISGIETEEVKPERGEIIFVEVALSILSGFIFGFIWQAFLLKSAKELAGVKRTGLLWLIGAIVPFAGIFVTLHVHRSLEKRASELGISIGSSAPAAALGVVFPILPVNVIALALLQSKINKLYRAEDKE